MLTFDWSSPPSLTAVSAGDARLGGVQDLRDSAPQPVCLHGRGVQQPARPPRRRPHGGHTQGGRGAPGRYCSDPQDLGPREGQRSRGQGDDLVVIFGGMSGEI